jgi:8-oxo-dGTP pyrophosphatase MutT (NUDIX family)
MAKKKIYRAGVIPYIIEDGEIQMMFMRPSKTKYGGDVFQIAKGKYEEGETAMEAGLREAKEELGLFGGNIEHLDELGTFMGRTTIFVAQIKDKDMFGEPHFETKEVTWMTPEQFQKEGRDLHKPVIKAAVRKITKLVNLKEQQLQEIEVVSSQPGPGFDIKDFDDGEQIGWAEEFPLWKHQGREKSNIIMYSIKSKDNDTIIGLVVGEFFKIDGKEFFVIGRSWTPNEQRRKGLITALYKALVSKVNISLMSDEEQSPEMREVWKKIPLKQYVYDVEKKKIIDRDNITDKELYSGNRYRLVLESHYIKETETGIPPVGTMVLKGYIHYTHPDNKGKYI